MGGTSVCSRSLQGPLLTPRHPALARCTDQAGGALPSRFWRLPPAPEDNAGGSPLLLWCVRWAGAQSRACQDPGPQGGLLAKPRSPPDDQWPMAVADLTPVQGGALAGRPWTRAPSKCRSQPGRGTPGTCTGPLRALDRAMRPIPTSPLSSWAATRPHSTTGCLQVGHSPPLKGLEPGAQGRPVTCRGSEATSAPSASPAHQPGPGPWAFPGHERAAGDPGF